MISQISLENDRIGCRVLTLEYWSGISEDSSMRSGTDLRFPSFAHDMLNVFGCDHVIIPCEHSPKNL